MACLYCPEQSLLGEVDIWAAAYSGEGTGPKLEKVRKSYPEATSHPVTQPPCCHLSVLAPSNPAPALIQTFLLCHVNPCNFSQLWKRSRCRLLFLKYFKFCLTRWLTTNAACRDHFSDYVTQNNKCSVRKCFCAKISVGNIA